jgi:stage II sporulation protein D
MKKHSRRRPMVIVTLLVLGSFGLASWRSVLTREDVATAASLPEGPVMAASMLPAVYSVAVQPAAVTAPAPVAAPRKSPVVHHAPVAPVTASPLKRTAQLVRVHIFADAKVDTLKLQSKGGLSVVPHRKKLGGVLTLSVDHDRLVLKQASLVVMTTPRIKVFPIVQGGTIEMQRPHAAPRSTAGELLFSVKDGHLLVINVLDLDTYVMGVVQPELGSLNLPIEALKAQLVASRSYILALGDRHPKQEFDFCDTAHCQVFAGIGHYPSRFLKAAAATRGVYLSYKGKPAAAFFHHSCGGQTASIQDIWRGPQVPYLRRVQDGPADHPYCGIGSRQQWHFTATASALRNCFAKKNWIHGREALDSVRVIRFNLSGRAAQVLIQSSQPRWVSAETLRSEINRYFGREVLLSTWFTITRIGDSYDFRGKGWGHGVGMCQVGSIAMAKHGFTYQQILSHYFPGTTLSEIPAEKKVILKKDPALLQFFGRIKDSLS